MALFTILFGRWAKMPSDGLPYSLFAFAALVPWTFFANALGTASASLIGNTHLIGKVYFPRLLISLSSLGTGLIDLAVALGVMLVMMAFHGTPPTWHLVALPPLVLLIVLIAFGVGSTLAALNVMYRDIRFVVPFLTQVWMFASPVIYPVSFIPVRWRWAFYLNPMVGAIDGFRAALLGAPFNLPAIACSCGVTLLILWVGLSYFRRIETRVADFV
jgi:lipopolysaccharide transport system permease protein